MTKFQKAVAIFSLVGSVAFAGNAYADEGKPNCSIRITNTSANGQKEKIQFGTHLNSKAECQALARIHERATPAETVVTKKVVFKWRGHNAKLKHFALR